MPDGHATWLTAAACTMTPAPPTRFGDLPPRHRKDIVRLGFLSAIAFGYTIATCILAQPIPSRSLHVQVALPHATAPRSALMEALMAPPTPPRAAPAQTNGRWTPAGVRPVAVSRNDAVPQPRSGRRGNVFSRFFKGVWRTVS